MNKQRGRQIKQHIEKVNLNDNKMRVNRMARKRELRSKKIEEKEKYDKKREIWRKIETVIKKGKRK